MALWGLKIGRSQQERLTVRDGEKGSKKRRETLQEGAAWMISASTMEKEYPIIISAHILSTYTPGYLHATVNSAVGIICHLFQRAEGAGGWASKLSECQTLLLFASIEILSYSFQKETLMHNLSDM